MDPATDAEAASAQQRLDALRNLDPAVVASLKEEVQVLAEAINATTRPGQPLYEHEVVLHEEVPVVQRTVEPVERVRLGTETVPEQGTVTEQVRSEQIDVEGDDHRNL